MLSPLLLVMVMMSINHIVSAKRVYDNTHLGREGDPLEIVQEV